MAVLEVLRWVLERLEVLSRQVSTNQGMNVRVIEQVLGCPTLVKLVLISAPLPHLCLPRSPSSPCSTSHDPPFLLVHTHPWLPLASG